jgi:hypothetical protein
MDLGERGAPAAHAQLRCAPLIQLRLVSLALAKPSYPSPEGEGSSFAITFSVGCRYFGATAERCRQDLMNESRSGLRTSACVVSMPWG